MKVSGKSEDWRIYVFISSTLRDMKADRDHLVKFTFLHRDMQEVREIRNERE